MTARSSDCKKLLPQGKTKDKSNIEDYKSQWFLTFLALPSKTSIISVLSLYRVSSFQIALVVTIYFFSFLIYESFQFLKISLMGSPS